MNFKLLNALGVGEKSALLYLAGLSLGPASVQELARKAGMKRPTVYLRLSELIDQGLFEKSKVGKKTYYKAVDPSVLEEVLKNNLAIVQAELPKLTALQSNNSPKPEVRVLEGAKGIKEIVEEITNEKSLQAWISETEDANKAFHSVYGELIATICQQGGDVEEIRLDNREARKQARATAKIAGPTYNVRVAASGGELAPAGDILIYGGVVALVSVSGLSVSIVRIGDVNITAAHKALFAEAWKSARPVK